MGIILCPGLVARETAPAFWQAISNQCTADDRRSLVILPQDCPTYSPKHVWDYLEPHLKAQTDSWSWIAYSAGVVGGLAAARQSHPQFPVQGFFALDAWGVSLDAPFPVYHLSHDWLTHRVTTLVNSHLVGSFYAQPSVSHLGLWQSPQSVTGWEDGNGTNRWTTAATFIAHHIFQDA